MWALRCTQGDVPQAEDALQEVYLKVLSGRAKFGERSSLKTWLLALIRHTVVDEWRRGERNAARLVAFSAVPTEDVVAPDEALAASQAQAGVRVALAALPERQREVVTLVFYHDLTLDEAADVMGIAAGTARAHYDRAKTQLRTQLTTL